MKSGVGEHIHYQVQINAEGSHVNVWVERLEGEEGEGLSGIDWSVS